MSLDPLVANRILTAYNTGRGAGPGATLVAARKNRRTLASVRRLSDGPVRLNVARAVVSAGPEAWDLLGPALQGNREARRRLARLSRTGLEAAARSASPPGATPGGNGRTPSPLPDTPCQGTPHQQRVLRLIVRWVKSSSGYADAFPDQLQLRVSRRMSSSYGSHMTRDGTHRITITHRLFRPGLEDILLDTVLHELAHLLDALTNGRGRSFHDASWRRWCRRLGATPERLISPASARRVRQARGEDGPCALPTAVARWAREQSP